MKLVIFGLTVSSSWGNGHATIWRGLCRALAQRGHKIVFFERDVPYYAEHRDLTDPPGVDLVLYSDWESASLLGRKHLSDADAGIVTSYCPDGIAASELVLSSRVDLHVFYDLDAPVTLESLDSGQPLSYVGGRGFRDFDLVLSYTGGKALDALRERLGARRVAPLYGSVDPAVHQPSPPVPEYAATLSYLGTYAEDRQERLKSLFIEPARSLPQHRFVIGGSMYPQDFPWTENIFFRRHVPPPDHPAFYCSSALTLNVTRKAMADMGYCPSGRLFEAAACGTPILSDHWEGLDSFFTPGAEILIAKTTKDAVESIMMPREELSRIARAARERTLEEHTADRRAVQLEQLFHRALQPSLNGGIL